MTSNTSITFGAFKVTTNDVKDVAAPVKDVAAPVKEVKDVKDVKDVKEVKTVVLQQAADATTVKKIGEGAYGCVYTTNIPGVVIKNIAHSYDLDSTTMREIAALNVLKGSNIVGMHAFKTSYTSTKLYLEEHEVNLHKYINTPGFLDKETGSQRAKIVAFQILDALYNAQKVSITHRDLKPENILVKKDKIPFERLKTPEYARAVSVCDWGMSRFQESHDPNCFTPTVQTIWYRAPELLVGDLTYDTCIDMWSFGCILYEMLTGEPLFPTRVSKGENEAEVQLQKIFSVLGTPFRKEWNRMTTPNGSPTRDKMREAVGKWPHFEKRTLLTKEGDDKDCADLLSKILVYEPDKRIKIIDALNHKWFDDIRKEKYTFVPLVDSLPTLETQIDKKYVGECNDNNRKAIVKCISGVCKNLGLSKSTYYLAIKYFDLYCSKKGITDLKTSDIALGGACLMAAAKIVEIHLPSLDEYANSFNIKNVFSLIDKESDVINTLGGRLYQPTEYTYLRLLVSSPMYNLEEMAVIADEKLERAVQSVKMLEKTPLETAREIVKQSAVECRAKRMAREVREMNKAFEQMKVAALDAFGAVMDPLDATNQVNKYCDAILKQINGR